jgi:uncharacterized OB-fold protein
VSRDEDALSPTYLAMQRRKAWSDEHLFEESAVIGRCNRCGRRRFYPDHCTREEDKAAVLRWKDAIAG